MMYAINNGVLSQNKYYQFCVWDLKKLRSLKISQVLVKVGICESLSEAKQKLKEGAIREGCSIDLTPWGDCDKVFVDRLVDEWDLFRMGHKLLIIYNSPPNLIKRIKNFFESLPSLRYENYWYDKPISVPIKSPLPEYDQLRHCERRLVLIEECKNCKIRETQIKA